MKGSVGTSTGIVTLRDPSKVRRKKTSFKLREDKECKLCHVTIFKGENAYGVKSAPMHSACNRKFKKWLREGK